MRDVALLSTVAAGLAAIRYGWRGDERVAWLGWAAIAIAIVVAAALDGAWGIALMLLALSTVAAVPVAVAAWTSAPARLASPRGRARAVANQTDRALARRLSVFLLVVPVGCLAATTLAFGIQAAVRGAGYGDANALATILFVQPVAWGVLASVQMLAAGPRAMIVPALACALPGLLLWAVA